MNANGDRFFGFIFSFMKIIRSVKTFIRITGLRLLKKGSITKLECVNKDAIFSAMSCYMPPNPLIIASFAHFAKNAAHLMLHNSFQ